MWLPWWRLIRVSEQLEVSVEAYEGKVTLVGLIRVSEQLEVSVEAYEGKRGYGYPCCGL